MSGQKPRSLKQSQKLLADCQKDISKAKRKLEKLESELPVGKDATTKNRHKREAVKKQIDTLESVKEILMQNIARFEAAAPKQKSTLSSEEGIGSILMRGFRNLAEQALGLSQKQKRTEEVQENLEAEEQTESTGPVKSEEEVVQNLEAEVHRHRDEAKLVLDEAADLGVGDIQADSKVLMTKAIAILKACKTLEKSLKDLISLKPEGSPEKIRLEAEFARVTSARELAQQVSGALINTEGANRGANRLDVERQARMAFRAAADLVAPDKPEDLVKAQKKLVQVQKKLSELKGLPTLEVPPPPPDFDDEKPEVPPPKTPPPEEPAVVSEAPPSPPSQPQEDGFDVPPPPPPPPLAVKVTPRASSRTPQEEQKSLKARYEAVFKMMKDSDTNYSTPLKRIETQFEGENGKFSADGARALALRYNLEGVNGSSGVIRISDEGTGDKVKDKAIRESLPAAVAAVVALGKTESKGVIEIRGGTVAQRVAACEAARELGFSGVRCEFVRKDGRPSSPALEARIEKLKEFATPHKPPVTSAAARWGGAAAEKHKSQPLELQVKQSAAAVDSRGVSFRGGKN